MRVSFCHHVLNPSSRPEPLPSLCHLLVSSRAKPRDPGSFPPLSDDTKDGRAGSFLFTPLKEERTPPFSFFSFLGGGGPPLLGEGGTPGWVPHTIRTWL